MSNNGDLAQKLDPQDRDTLFRLSAQANLLQERVGRLQAEAELAQARLRETQEKYTELSQTMRSKYSLDDGDSVSIEDGAIIRAKPKALPLVEDKTEEIDILA
jgi:hypothetical protein